MGKSRTEKTDGEGDVLDTLKDAEKGKGGGDKPRNPRRSPRPSTKTITDSFSESGTTDQGADKPKRTRKEK